MPAQRARPTIPAEDASAHPAINGVPWWAAILVATTATLLGIAFDSFRGTGQLSSVFAALYFIGCVAAVLLVKRSGIFTAVVQPPLLLFIAVPGAYYLFHRAAIDGLKDLLINCGYPLIERFLLMFTTSVAVLLIGMARWYFAGQSRPAAQAREATEPSTGRPALTAKAAALLGTATAAISKAFSSVLSKSDEGVADGEEAPKRPQRTARPASARRRGERTATSHSRHARPPMDDRAPEPRRRRHAAPEDFDGYREPPRRPRRPAAEYEDPTRRRRPPGDPEQYRPRHDERDPYAPPPRRRPPPEGPRRGAPERRRPGQGDYRPEDYRPTGPGYRRGPEDPRRGEPGRPGPRPHRYLDDMDRPDQPPRRRPAPGDENHHPVSRVRYRGEPPADPQGPPRRPRHSREPRD